ncbi:MAG: glycogen debranching enzyme, partial [Armatimonadetes bacterium]|nr:glycogen debranching enzyme [Candidatus Hippobium faecium]
MDNFIKILKPTEENIYILPGYPNLPGTNYVGGEINFNIVSKYGKKLKILIFRKEENEPSFEISCPHNFRLGFQFSFRIGGIDWSLYDYVFRMEGMKDEKEGLLFDENNFLLDPYANKINGMEKWGEERTLLKSEILPSDFVFNNVNNYRKKTENLIIYEMHLRGFTAGEEDNEFRGTYLGLQKKIPYLKKLGVNCVELMPIFEFDELQNTNLDLMGHRLKNYWGYSTVSFFAPKSGYAYGEVISELKQLIAEFHKNDIEVWLDVVFNHTAEMGSDGPCYSFRGLDNKTYYMLDEEGNPLNYTGCGNTFNCNNVIVRDFIINCLRYWKTEFSADGFRFDLASVMTRDEKGNVLSNPPLLERISNDPILADCRLVAEPWDAVGLYQLGMFYDNSRWLEWNGKYRDTVRRFLRGDDNIISELKNRIDGSADLYGNSNLCSINFICCHDGFTLMDLFSYNEKHNENNGEINRDGSDWNLSCNFGVEGETDNPDILALRKKMIKNALIILFMSKGIPMILMGDECGRTQKG